MMFLFCQERADAVSQSLASHRADEICIGRLADRVTVFKKHINDAILDASRNDRRAGLRTTITLEDELMAKARSYTGIVENGAILREALKALIEREASRRLARLGGSAPGLKDIPRRRPVE